MKKKVQNGNFIIIKKKKATKEEKGAMAQIPKLKRERERERERERIIMRCSHFGSLLVRSEQVKLWGPQQRRRSVYPTNWRTVAPASCLVHEVVERLRPAALQQTRCEVRYPLQFEGQPLQTSEKGAGGFFMLGGMRVGGWCGCGQSLFWGSNGAGVWVNPMDAPAPGPWTLDPLPICLLGQVLFLYSQLFMGWLQLSDLATIQIHGHIKWQK